MNRTSLIVAVSGKSKCLVIPGRTTKYCLVQIKKRETEFNDYSLFIYFYINFKCIFNLKNTAEKNSSIKFGLHVQVSFFMNFGSRFILYEFWFAIYESLSWGSTARFPGSMLSCWRPFSSDGRNVL